MRKGVVSCRYSRPNSSLVSMPRIICTRHVHASRGGLNIGGCCVQVQLEAMRNVSTVFEGCMNSKLGVGSKSALAEVHNLQHLNPANFEPSDHNSVPRIS